MSPVGADAILAAAANLRSYPSFSSRGIITPPTAMDAATDEPDMEPNRVLPRILVWARPPGIKPTNSLAKLISFWAIPPEFIRTPHKMKKGTAINEKLSTPVIIFWLATKVAKSRSITQAVVRTDETIRLMDTGTLRASSRKNVPIKIKPTCTTDIVMICRSSHSHFLKHPRGVLRGFVFRGGIPQHIAPGISSIPLHPPR